MASSVILLIFRHYYKVSITLFLAVVTVATISQTIGPDWLEWVAFGLLVLWVVWASIYIHRTIGDKRG